MTDKSDETTADETHQPALTTDRADSTTDRADSTTDRAESTTDRTDAPDEHGERDDSADRDRRDTNADRDGGRGPRRMVLWVALLGLGLVSLVLLFQFYASASQAIGDWVGPAYRSLVRTGFSLLLLCLSLAGIAYVTRELTSPSE